MQELQALGQLVVELEHGGDAEQHEEPEVDHRVHEPGGGVAAAGSACRRRRGSRVRRLLHVLRGGAAPVGCATLPVAHSVREGERAPHQQHRDDRVERHLQRAGDAVEHLHGRAPSCRASPVNCGMMPEATVNRPMTMPRPMANWCGLNRLPGSSGAGDVFVLIASPTLVRDPGVRLRRAAKPALRSGAVAGEQARTTRWRTRGRPPDLRPAAGSGRGTRDSRGRGPVRRSRHRRRHRSGRRSTAGSADTTRR